MGFNELMGKATRGGMKGFQSFRSSFDLPKKKKKKGSKSLGPPSLFDLDEDFD